MFHPKGPTFLELVRQALSSTERGYDLLAPKFDFTPFRTPAPVVEAMGRFIAEAGPLESGLDVCCGTGALLAEIKPLCRERVVGVDFSAGMLGQARERASAAPGTARVELVRANVLELPFREEFDVVVSAGAFGHILPRDETRFIGGIARALRSGGRFVFATGEMPSPRAPAWWLARGFNAAMHVRNALIEPEFIMYYLTFLWPDVRRELERHGLGVEARFGACAHPFERVILVAATK